MRLYLLILLLLFSVESPSNVLVKSEHSVPVGMAELNTFKKTCGNKCSFTGYINVNKLHFSEDVESGAFLLVRSEGGTKSFSVGIKANEDDKSAELVVMFNDGKNNSDSIVLAKSSLNAWEGFLLSWHDKELLIENLRSVKKIGLNNTPYSQIEKSGITYQTTLTFSPDHIAYMFMGSDAEMWIEMKNQNYNSSWKERYDKN